MIAIQKMRADLVRQRELLDAKIAMLDELLAAEPAGETPPAAVKPRAEASAGKPTPRPERTTEGADEKKRSLLRLLAANPDGLRVNELVERLGWEVNVVRYHLKCDLFESADPSYRLSPFILSKAGEKVASELSPTPARET